MFDDFDFNELIEKLREFAQSNTMRRYVIYGVFFLVIIGPILIFWPSMWTYIFAPLIVAVLTLVIEYWGIQPLKSERNNLLPIFRKSSRDWATAQRKAIKALKAQKTEYEWGTHQECIRVESFQGARGLGTLIVTILTQDYFRGGKIGKPTIIEKLQLTIDKAGDILQQKSIPIPLPEIPDIGTNKIMEQIFGSAPIPSNSFYGANPSPMNVSIKDIKNPVIKKTNKNISVVIKFTVENTGRAGKVYPYIEFKIKELRPPGSWVDKIISTPSSWVVTIGGYGSCDLSYEWLFPLPTVPLLKSPDDIKIKLYTSPIT